MNKYKLIKLKEGCIIVSDETPKNNDYALYDKYIRKVDSTFNQPGMDWNALNTRKIIASTFILDLPNIDFNGLEEEFGIIDIGKLAENLFPTDFTKMAMNNVFENRYIQHGFIEGFNKCLSLNKDKLFTLEDLRIVFGLGAANNANGKPSFEDIIQSLQPKEWDIEIETEYIKDFYRDGFGGAGTIDIKQPKLTNNQIKILKIK